MKLKDRLRELSQDLEFEKWFKEYSKYKPPNRKIPLYIDKNFPVQVIDEIISRPKQFKIVKIMVENDEDQSIYTAAKKEEAIIITCDEDFWDDIKFPMQQSPGVIIVKGSTATEIGTALALFIYTLDLVDAIRRNSDWTYKQKFRINVRGYTGKYITYENKKEHTTIEY